MRSIHSRPDTSYDGRSLETTLKDIGFWICSDPPDITYTAANHKYIHNKELKRTRGLIERRTHATEYGHWAQMVTGDGALWAVFIFEQE